MLIAPWPLQPVFTLDSMLSTAEIERLLAPYTATRLSDDAYRKLAEFLALLLKWNARTNLTAVREPDAIVRRHLGESLFAAEKLLPQPVANAFDLGSGAGFPGLPMAIYSPESRFTLIESQNKKATFLKEAARHLGLKNVTVFAERAEQKTQQAELVTMRAVEKFGEALPQANALVAPQGRLALLVGSGQVEAAKVALPVLRWDAPVAVPESDNRVLLVAKKP
jgi:16S rRNA (guanine527-N7)-methyltransferase